MIKDLLANIVNSKNDDPFLYTGSIYSMEPLQVKLYPDDDPIDVKSVIGAIGLTSGSNVLMVKYLSKFIIIGVIGDPMEKFIDYVIKQNDESRNTTTTMANDGELTLTLPANGEYQIDLMLYVRGDSGTPDIKIDYNYSNTTNLSYRNAWGPETTTTSTNNVVVKSSYYGIDTDIPYAATGTSDETNICETLFVETKTSGLEGSITLRWAQNTSSADNTIVKAGSVLKYTRIDSFPYAGTGSLAGIISDIEDNATNIATNAANIATNTSNISTNTSNISTNTSNISTNTSNISTNTSNISTNTSNISTNTSNISTNTSNISSNTSDISDLQDDKQPNIVYRTKSTNESVTSSTTLQNDDDFYIDINTNGTYKIDLYLAVYGSTAGDIDIDWTVTGGVSQLTERHCNGVAQGSTSGYTTEKKSRTYDLVDRVSYGTVSTGYEIIIHETFLVSKSGTNGRLQMRFAQAVSDGTATTITTESFMTITKVTSSTSI